MENKVLQTLIEAVAGALTGEFGCPVYQNDVAQGFEQPSFFLKTSETSRKRRRGQRYFQQVPLEILCFPTEDGDNQELTLRAEKLYDLLELLPLPEGPPWNGGTLRGVEMRHRIEDGVLQFFVTYRFYLWWDRADIYMETVKMDFKKG